MIETYNTRHVVLCSGSYHYEFSTNFQTSKNIILTKNKLMIEIQILSFKKQHLHPLSLVSKILLILKKYCPLMTFSRDFMFRVVNLLVFQTFKHTMLANNVLKIYLPTFRIKKLHLHPLL